MLSKKRVIRCYLGTAALRKEAYPERKPSQITGCGMAVKDPDKAEMVSTSTQVRVARHEYHVLLYRTSCRLRMTLLILPLTGSPH